MRIASVTIAALAALAGIASAAEVIHSVGRSTIDTDACYSADEVTGWVRAFFPEAKIDNVARTAVVNAEVHAYVGKWHAFAEFKDGCLVAAALAK